MKMLRGARAVPLFMVVAVLAACATPPASDVEPPKLTVAPALTPPEPGGGVDETSMLPLLGYQQLLMQQSPAELARERRVLAAVPQTPRTQVRQAMLLGQMRGANDLPGALGLLNKVLRSGDLGAVSLRPLTMLLASQYLERLRLQTQSDKLSAQLSETLQRSGELQQKLDALADVERALAARPGSGEALPVKAQ